VNTFKPVLNYENDYEVNECGVVRRIRDKGNSKAGHIMKQRLDRKGYPIVYLSKNGKDRHPRVHKLVMEVFVAPMPKGYTVNHKNGIKTDNHLGNLEYMTPSQNSLHAQHDLEHYKVTAKLTNEKVIEILSILATGVDCRKVAKMFSVCDNTINEIKNGNTWKWIPRPDMSKTKNRSKLSAQDRTEIRKLLNQGVPQKDIAEKFSVTQSHISHILHNKR